MGGAPTLTTSNDGPLPGQVLGDRFFLEARVATGGMGAVYAALDHHSGQRVALKVLRSQGNPAIALDRFEAEAQVLARLTHPAIVRYVAHGVHEGATPYLAMEWLEGESLAARLARGRLSLDEALAVATQAADALAFAHALGVVHRDVKPANLIVEGQGSHLATRLLDFGIAKGGAERHFVTRTGTVVGTPGYMAPEQARGDADIDARADVFALGCVLFECLAGAPAFRGGTLFALLGKLLLETPPSLLQVAEGTPPAVAELVARMLAKDRTARPRDGGALLAELRRLPFAASASGGPPSEPEHLTYREQRFVSLVVAGEVGPSGVEGDAALAATLTAREALQRREVERTVAPFAARVEWTLRGGLLVLLAGAEGAKEQALSAARCALALRQALPQPPLALVTGRGEVGAGRLEGDILEQAVELLAGVPSPTVSEEGASPILLDAATAALLEDRFVVHVGERMRRLVGETPPDAFTAPRTLLGKPSPFVGRDRELATLRALYEQVADERVARAALVLAPAGAGKSRLVHEFVHVLPEHDRPPQRWLARTDPLAARAPFALVTQALRSAASLAPTEVPERARQTLRLRVGRHLRPADAQRVAEFLGEAMGLPFPDENRPALRAARQDKLVLAEQVRSAWLDWVRAEAAQGPLLLLLEDVHWADDASLRLVDQTLGELGEHPIFVLASARPELRSVHPELWASRGLHTLHLPELTRRASETLVCTVLGNALPPDTLRRLVEHAAGNAFFLEELIRATAEGRTDGFPDSVLALVQRRLEALPPDARHVLRAASVFGETAFHGGVGHLVGRSETAALDAAIALLVERELVARRPEAQPRSQAELTFRHALVREAAYATLTEEDRRRGHRLAAEWLEASGVGEPSVLGEHFERGGEPARAAGWYMRATQQAFWSDLRAAAYSASRGAACSAAGQGLGELRVQEGAAYYNLGDFEAAKRCVQEAARLLPVGSAFWCLSKTYLVSFALRLGDLTTSETHLRELLAAEPEPADSVPYVHLLLRSMFMHCHAGLPQVARRCLRRLDEVSCRGGGDPGLRGLRHLSGAVAARLLEGNPWRAAALAQAALDAFTEAAPWFLVAWATGERALGALLTGEAERAEALLMPLVADARKRQVGLLIPVFASLRALALVRLGRAEDVHAGLALLQAEVRRFCGCLEGLAALPQLARVELALLDSQSAAATAREVLTHALGAQLRSPALAVVARAALDAGTPDQALAAAREALALWHSEGAAGYDEPFLWASLYDALVANGRADDARALAREAAGRFQAIAAFAPDRGAARAFLAEPDIERLLLASG
ncbi:MAG TPA: protein kinase [Polyangiaceae bacterium]|nr:protein kinase [Polyangiaceae bacterium]